MSLHIVDQLIIIWGIVAGRITVKRRRALSDHPDNMSGIILVFDRGRAKCLGEKCWG